MLARNREASYDPPCLTLKLTNARFAVSWRHLKRDVFFACSGRRRVHPALGTGIKFIAGWHGCSRLARRITSLPLARSSAILARFQKLHVIHDDAQL